MTGHRFQIQYAKRFEWQDHWIGAGLHLPGLARAV
jgi:hypothetical protein